MLGSNYIPGWANVVSTINSTEVVATSFPGAYENIPLPWAGVTCYSDDQPGTLTITFSHDGVNAVSSFTKSVAAGVNKFIPIEKLGRSMKVDWSSSVAPTTLSLQTSYGMYHPGIFSIDGSIDADAGAQLVVPVDPVLYVSAGRIGGQYPVTKFGRAPDGLQSASTPTDVWDLADSSATQSVWLAPTAARIHTLVSDDSDDDEATGAGAKTIRVWYLSDWDTRETFEDVDMDGTSGVAMANAAVMINRMRVIDFGANGSNVGTITATAATDSTITAVIRPGVGSTAMAVFGWPSTQNLYVKSWKASINKASGSATHAVFQLFYNPIPDSITTGFDEVDLTGRQSTGTSSGQERFDPYLELSGPGIVKISGISSSDDVDANAGFSGVLVDI